MTGAGMMDCKAALDETSGDMEAAVDWLRKKGLAKAAKKAGRVAAEGLIGVAVEGTKGVVVEVNSETDFVARNDLFQGLVQDDRQCRARRRHRRREDQGGQGRQHHRRRRDRRHHRQDRREHDAAPRRRACRSARASIGSYVHNSVIDGLGKIGVLVALEFGRQGRRARRARPHGRDACRRRQSAGGRSVGLDPAVVRARRTCSRRSSRRRASPRM